MPEVDIIFFTLLAIVAFLYASVGHGGASGYLALMVFYSFSPETMRPAALILNIGVSLVSFIQFYKHGYFSWKLFWPFALASIPAAYIGGLMQINATTYKPILGVLLLFPVIRLFGFSPKNEETLKDQNLLVSIVIGATIGFLSGIIGIGGGIILSPVILLLHWAKMKQTAAVSALFIFVNSLAGLAGIISNGINLSNEIWLMIVLALTGGLIGAFFGAKHLENNWLKKILAFVLLIASVKLILT